MAVPRWGEVLEMYMLGIAINKVPFWVNIRRYWSARCCDLDTNDVLIQKLGRIGGSAVSPNAQVEKLEPIDRQRWKKVDCWWEWESTIIESQWWEQRAETKTI